MLTFTTILVIAFALAIDAFAVSVSTGLQLPRIGVMQTLRISGTFGFFQFLMPIIGWRLGAEAHVYISQFDHWIAFGLLVFVGLHMIFESWHNRGKSQDEQNFKDLSINSTLLMLGLATSLDALAVGLSFGLLSVTVWIPAFIIGIVCFLISAIGLHIGRWLTQLPGLSHTNIYANAIGGLVLILIGLNILYQHEVFI